MKKPVTVSVLCTAYNHEKFIRDAIEGVLMQKADFKYELLIHDDASADKTADIIKEYAKLHPDVIRTILQKENQYRRCNIYSEFLFPNAKGKYIAFCEGDDYWTDEHKLQRQVDFLELHPEYSMCMHNAVKLNYETGEERLLDTFPADGTYSQKEQVLAGLGTDFPAFASYVFRAGLLIEIPDFFLASNVLDYPIRQYLASKGSIYYFQKAMSAYRAATPQSYMKKTTQSQEFYQQYTLEMIRFFEKLNQYTGYKFDDILKRKLVSDYFGFCLSVLEAEGIEKAKEKGLDQKLVKACYRCLDPEYLDPETIALSERTDHLFIYGTSRIALICKQQLERAKIRFEGFVVSDGQTKAEEFCGRRAYYLSEVTKRYARPGFILAVQPVNAEALERALGQYGIKNYCKPYVIQNCE